MTTTNQTAAAEIAWAVLTNAKATPAPTAAYEAAWAAYHAAGNKADKDAAFRVIAAMTR